MDFDWCVLLLLFEKLGLFVEWFVELLVKDSDTSRLDNNDLLVNDNFSVVSSRKLLGEFAVVCACSVTARVVNVELSSDKISAFGVDGATVGAMRLELLVVLYNEVVLESGKGRNNRKN